MSVTVYEMLDSMSGSVSNDFEAGETREVRRSYVIGQCESFNDVVNKIEPYVPEYVQNDGTGIYWRRAKLDIAGIGNKYFQATATYSTLLPKGSGGGGGGGGPGPSDTDVAPGSIAWDTTGHTEHITEARFQQRYPETAPNFGDALNVSGDTVNGLDVVRPCLRYSETWIFPTRVAISASFLGAVYELTGTVNLEPFRAFKAGEALFMGARATWQGDLPYVAVTFDFEARPNVDDFSVKVADNPQPIQIQKAGWEYVWYLYETKENNNRLVQQVAAFYVAKLYEGRLWRRLLIGGQQIAQGRNGLPGTIVPPGGAGGAL
jgi:hypothetical protein